jgi:hypothetical protein
MIHVKAVAMDSSQDPLVEEARSLIHAAKESLENGGSITIVNPVTLAQGYLHLLIRQPTALYETKLREAVVTLRAALTESTSA